MAPYSEDRKRPRREADHSRLADNKFIKGNYSWSLPLVASRSRSSSSEPLSLYKGLNWSQSRCSLNSLNAACLSQGCLEAASGNMEGIFQRQRRTWGGSIAQRQLLVQRVISWWTPPILTLDAKGTSVLPLKTDNILKNSEYAVSVCICEEFQITDLWEDHLVYNPGFWVDPWHFCWKNYEKWSDICWQELRNM